MTENDLVKLSVDYLPACVRDESEIINNMIICHTGYMLCDSSINYCELNDIYFNQISNSKTIPLAENILLDIDEHNQNCISEIAFCRVAGGHHNNELPSLNQIDIDDFYDEIAYEENCMNDYLSYNGMYNEMGIFLDFLKINGLESKLSKDSEQYWNYEFDEKMPENNMMDVYINNCQKVLFFEFEDKNDTNIFKFGETCIIPGDIL